MKKLTKRVLAGGLWFDVTENTSYISADKFGSVKSHEAEPVIYGFEYWSCIVIGAVDKTISRVDLDGADWRECCWFVGDQVDGEMAERREWMARGVDLIVKETSPETVTGWIDGFIKKAMNDGSQSIAEKIRAGEIE